MSIIRMGELQAQAGQEEALRAFLITILPIIKGSEGSESCHLYQSQADPAKFFMVEVWDSVESHQASVKNIPPDLLTQIRPLLASSPSGDYYYLVAEKTA
jgi:heme oxygenase (mycobilin-producing)